MRGKALKSRRQRNRELAVLDASRRCRQCKRPLAEVPAVYEDFLKPGKFCSESCLEDALAGFERTGRA